MKKTVVLTLIVLFALTITPALWCYTSYSNDYSYTGFSSRPRGMGNTFTGLAEDIESIGWNSAGTAGINGIQLCAMYIPFWENISYSAAAVAIPTKEIGTFTIGYLNNTIPGFERRETLYDTPVTFSIIQQCLTAGYSKMIGKIYTGLNIKYLQENIDTYSSSTIGGDIGLVVPGNTVFVKSPVLNRCNFGIQFYNIIPPTQKFREFKETAQIVTRAGVSYEIPAVISKDIDKLVLLCDAAFTSGIPLTYNTGAEYSLYNTLFLRTGYDKSQESVSFGMGFLWKLIKLDYAYTQHMLSSIHQLSLTFKFANPEERFRKYIHDLAERSYTIGRQFMQNGKYLQAIDEWNKALLLEPDYADANEAKQLLEQKLEGDRQQKFLYQLTSMSQAAEILEKQGKLIESIDAWNKLLSLSPNDTKAPEAIKRIQARMSTEELARSRDKNVQGLLLEGSKLYDSKKYFSAIKTWEKALNAQPNNLLLKEKISDAKSVIRDLADTHYAAGVTLYNKNQLADAISQFEESLYYNPANIQAKDYLNRCQFRAKEKRQTVDTKTVDKLYYEAANAYMKGQYQDAKKVVEKILQMDPLNENAKRLLNKINTILGVQEQ
ncbi:MAG: PorV/PorQ family protein [Elusimicrobiota bacterium]